MDRLKDEPPAFEPRLCTYCHCLCRRRVVSAVIEKSTRMGMMTCGGMGFAGENAIWDYGLQTRGSVRQQLAYLASPFPPEPLKAVQNHLPQRVGVEATVCTAPSNQLSVDWKGRDDGGARRTRAGSKTSSCCRGCRHAILAASHGSGSGAEGCSLLVRKSMFTA